MATTHLGHFENIFSGILSELSLEYVLNFNYVSFAILDLLPFNPPKFTGSRDHGHGPFSEIFRSHVGLLLESMLAILEVCISNLKFVCLATLELLAFNPPNNLSHAML